MLLSPTTKNRIQGRGWGGELTLRRFGEKGEGRLWEKGKEERGEERGRTKEGRLME